MYARDVVIPLPNIEAEISQLKIFLPLDDLIFKDPINERKGILIRRLMHSIIRAIVIYPSYVFQDQLYESEVEFSMALFKEYDNFNRRLISGKFYGYGDIINITNDSCCNNYGFASNCWGCNLLFNNETIT